MSHKKKRLIIFVSAVLGIAICNLHAFFANCATYPVFCHPILLQIRDLLFIMSFFVFLTSIILFFVRKESFYTWVDYAKYYFPFVLLVFIYTQNNNIEKLSFSRFTDTQLAVIIFLPLSLLGTLFVVIRKAMQLNEDL